MHVRVVTLAYDPTLRGFSEAPLQQVLATGDLLEARDHFFTHGGMPQLCLVLVMDDGGAGRPRGAQRINVPEEDVESNMPESTRALYRVLRRWRNETARKEGIPSYVIMRNRQLADIAIRLPRSLAELKEIEGVGEGTAGKYGRDVLALIPPDSAVSGTGTASGSSG